jgi:hypothetical protein
LPGHAELGRKIGLGRAQVASTLRPLGLRVTPLHDEVVLHPGDGEAVEVPGTDQHSQVVDVARGEARIELDQHHPLRQLEADGQVGVEPAPFLRAAGGEDLRHGARRCRRGGKYRRRGEGEEQASDGADGAFNHAGDGSQSGRSR